MSDPKRNPGQRDPLTTRAGLFTVPTPTKREGPMTARDTIMSALSGILGVPAPHTNAPEQATADVSGLLSAVLALLQATPNGLRGLLAGRAPRTYAQAQSYAPQMFKEGSLENLRDLHPDVYKAIEATRRGELEGFSLDPRLGTQPSMGEAVAIDAASMPAGAPRSADMQRFLWENRAALSRPDTHIGGWKDGDEVLIELSRVLSDPKQAQALGRLFDQKATFNLGTFESANTGGRDLLKLTKK
jgi:hypothetical protein